MFPRIRTNILIFLISIITAFAFFYMNNNYNWFQASVLGLADRETIENNKRDIGYKNEKNVVDVFVSSDIKDQIQRMTLSIIYDSEEIELEIDKAEAQTKYEILTNTEGSLILVLTDFTNIDTDKSLYILPFKWDNPNILISEWSLLLSDGQKRSLAIGSLNQPKENHN